MKNSLGQRVKIKMGLEDAEERKKRVAREKKENSKAIEYFDRINKQSDKNECVNIVLPLNWLKKEFTKIAKVYHAREGKSFEVDEENKLILDIVCRYFANDPSFEEVVQNGNLKKGILLIGNCGTGKSSIFDIIQEIGRIHKIPQLWFSNTSTLIITSQFEKLNKQKSTVGGESIIEYYSKGKVYFDDLGSEEMVNNYGIKKELIREIIEIRYNRYKSLGTKTYCSSNLSVAELVAKYDKNSKPDHKRIEDRIYGMFNILPMYGESRR